MPVTALNDPGALLSVKQRGDAVNSNDQKNQARKVVSERLRLFFSQLQEQLASSTDELWKRVESKISCSKKEL
jgi:hypothetical protein